MTTADVANTDAAAGSSNRRDGSTDHQVKDRLVWLRRNEDGYAPQPYEQLARFYRLHGNEQAAWKVAISKQRARRANVRGWRRWPSRGWSALLRWTIGYGYRPALALIPFTILLLTGSVLFDAAYPADLRPAKTGIEQPDFNSFRRRWTCYCPWELQAAGRLRPARVCRRGCPSGSPSPAGAYWPSSSSPVWPVVQARLRRSAGQREGLPACPWLGLIMPWCRVGAPSTTHQVSRSGHWIPRRVRCTKAELSGRGSTAFTESTVNQVISKRMT